MMDPLTVKQLRDMLDDAPSDMLVILPANPLGDYTPLGEAGVATYWPYIADDIAVGDLWIADDVFPQAPPYAFEAFFLWPVSIETD